MGRSWQSSMDVLHWTDGKGMGVAGDTPWAGRPGSPATLRLSLFLSSRMKVWPGKGGGLNGVSRNGQNLLEVCTITFVLRYAQLARRWRENHQHWRVSRLHTRGPFRWWVLYRCKTYQNNLHKKSFNYISADSGLIISGGWHGTPHGYVRSGSDGLSSVEMFAESGNPNCSIPDVPSGKGRFINDIITKVPSKEGTRLPIELFWTAKKLNFTQIAGPLLIWLDVSNLSFGSICR